jgi:hypothetical protein
MSWSKTLRRKNRIAELEASERALLERLAEADAIIDCAAAGAYGRARDDGKAYLAKYKPGGGV